MGEWFAAHRNNDRHLLALVSIRRRGGGCGGEEEAPFGQGLPGSAGRVVAMASRMGYATRKVENSWAWRGWNRAKRISRCGRIWTGAGGRRVEFCTLCARLPGWVGDRRGADDNKGPAVAVLYLLCCLKALNVPLRHGVRVVAGRMRNAHAGRAFFCGALSARGAQPGAGLRLSRLPRREGIMEAEIITRERLSADVLSLSGASPPIPCRIARSSPVRAARRIPCGRTYSPRMLRFRAMRAHCAAWRGQGLHAAFRWAGSTRCTRSDESAARLGAAERAGRGAAPVSGQRRR